MPLSDPGPRQRLHTRTIVCEGFRREDGLIDVEAHLEDLKPYGFENEYRGSIAPDEPLHGMRMRLTIDEEYRIHAVETAMDETPFAICGEIQPDYRKLVGETIGRGWSRKVRELFGGTHGCTHLSELLGRMATVAYQTMYSVRRDPERRTQKTGKPAYIDGCHAMRSDGPVVRRWDPDWYTGDDSAA